MKKIKDGKWAYSLNGEYYYGYNFFETKQDAINNAIIDENYNIDSNIIYVGQVETINVEYVIKTSIDIENIFEDIRDTISCDSHLELSGEYLNYVKKEDRIILENNITKTILEWIEKYNYEPNFFNIINSEKIKISETQKTMIIS